jgi:hypothetical protein
MKRLVTIVLFILFVTTTTSAQTTGFTYQGRLTDGGTPANGVYDLQFGLWDSQTSGSQIGSTQSFNSIQVANGVFTVTLDFGANAFPGASRFLEIGARVSGAGSFTLLAPRQAITSTPYAVRSLRATTADSVPVSGVPAGSGNYIQNASSPQAVSNFNISGNGTVGGTLTGSVVHATTQFNLNGSRILSNPGTENLFVGTDTGAANTNGFQNTFVGFRAGRSNTIGRMNTFFGSLAGAANQGGEANVFVGNLAGFSNTNAGGNAFFGSTAGFSNTSGDSNAFFGNQAGRDNQTGNANAFFGAGAGIVNLLGNRNSFFGILAGSQNTGGSSNTAIGAFADVLAGESVSVTNATAIGADAFVTNSNSLVLGSINGINGATADTNVGIGTTAPIARLHVRANGGNILLGDPDCGAGSGAIGFGSSLSGCNNYALLGGDGNTYINRPSGGTIIFREGNGPNQVEIRPGGTVGIGVLGTGGSIQLCRNGAAAISTCSSSLRYKTEINPFSGGLQLISRLQPVSFNWKTTHQPDIGLIAEEVAKVEPRLTFKNQSGEIEGVNYSQLTAVLINAIKEQQKQIDAQEKKFQTQENVLRQQEEQIRALKKLVCQSNSQVDLCKASQLRTGPL